MALLYPWNEAQKEWAKSHVSAIVDITPAVFLRLTTDGPAHLREIQDEALSLATYLRHHSKEGPFLLLDQKTGQILSHEGRHRAAAVMAKGGTFFRIGIVLDPYRIASRISRKVRKLTWDDVPLIWKAEHEEGFRINTNREIAGGRMRLVERSAEARLPNPLGAPPPYSPDPKAPKQGEWDRSREDPRRAACSSRGGLSRESKPLVRDASADRDAP